VSVRLTRLLAFAVLGPLALALLWWSWRAWPDLVIDFGREAYVPWRLSEGAALYRDIEYLNGPLSPYLNAFWFRLFGVGLTTLFAANFALLAILTALLYELMTAAGDRLAAALACALLLVLFGFGQYVGVGNYNHLAPYSHEATHGLLLGLLAIALAYAWSRRGGSARLAGAGLALGLCSLTKAETFAAAAAAVVPGLLLCSWVGPRRLSAGEAAAFALTALVPAGLAFGALSLAMPAPVAFGGVAGTWLHLFTSSVASMEWYARSMGTSDVGASLLVICAWFGGLLLALAPAAGLALLLGRFEVRDRALATFGTLLAYGGVLWLLRDRIDWMRAPRLLPASLLVALVALVTCLWRRRPERFGERSFLKLMLLVYALALLAKIFLNARIAHYGFTLALPATVVLVVAGASWAPDAIERAGGVRHVFVAAFAALLVLPSASLLSRANGLLSAKSEFAAGGADRIRGYPVQARTIDALMGEIEANVSAGETLAVLPEGVMVNYLARRASSVRYFSFTPFDFILVVNPQHPL